MNQGPVGIVTYLGIDGACAAAAALLRHPGSELWVTSRARVAHTLNGIATADARWQEIHVCGVGVGRDVDGAATAAAALSGQGVRVTWHCGRGYLDGHRERLAISCSPRFSRADSNTAALVEHLAPSNRKRAEFLCRLARLDPNIGRRTPRPAPAQLDWILLIRAAITQYFKYEDQSRYLAAVASLAAGRIDEEELRLARLAEAAGTTYRLEGRSPAVRELRRRIGLAAAADAPVLITGESGTGKERVAHLVHEGSGRAAEPFVPVNCALFAGNSELVNADLFGHARGAFTGADRERPGRFEVADNGTLFLDEIGELPLTVQAKLLRVLEDGRVERLGESGRARTVNVRVIAATNRNLARAVSDGFFREDLFHRLDVLPLTAPPLRERRQDIAGLARSAWTGRALDRASLAALEDYHWPGNVRQLRKLLDRARAFDQPVAEALAEEQTRLAAASAATAPASLPATADGIEPLDRFRRRYALRALEILGGNRSATARALGVTVNTLKAWIT